MTRWINASVIPPNLKSLNDPPIGLRQYSPIFYRNAVLLSPLNPDLHAR
jgi:hypothetical protein